MPAPLHLEIRRPAGRLLAGSDDYARFVADLKGRIESARVSTIRNINAEIVLLYWDIGRDIVEHQRRLGWGDAVVEWLARDLRAAFPSARGFSASSLWRMRQWYVALTAPGFLAQVAREFPQARGRPPILAQAVRELAAGVPWGHHVEILHKGLGPAPWLYYLRAAARLGWSRRTLLSQIRSGAYEHSLAPGKTHNFARALPGHLAEQAEEALKSSYNLEFLGLGGPVRERELEERLVVRLRDFILELGSGFCFVGRQHRLVLGRKEYFVDLLFYHRLLKALVAIDLKVGAFEPEYSGKMDFYLNVLNDRERAPGDHPSIGIILCAERENLAVEYALRSKGNPIGVAEYRLWPTLPGPLRGKLPSARQLNDALRPALLEPPMPSSSPGPASPCRGRSSRCSPCRPAPRARRSRRSSA